MGGNPHKETRRATGVVSHVICTPSTAVANPPASVHGDAAERLLCEVRGRTLKLSKLAKLSVCNWLASLPTPVQRLVAGGFAGALSKTVTAPLETVRIRSMTSRATMGSTVTDVWRSGGPLAFFAGNSADLLRVVPSKSIELAAFDFYKTLLTGGLRPRGRRAKRQGRAAKQQQQQGGEPLQDGGEQQQEQQQQHQAGPLQTAVAGAAAGMTAQLLLFPLETVRTRMAAAPAAYPTIRATMASIAYREGLGSFWKGLDASLIGIVPYAALKLGLYDGLKWSYRKHTGKQHVPPGASALAGAIAGVLSASATYPLEVARRRMMMGGAGYPNTVAALVDIARADGFGALYSGIQLSWLKQAPQYAITFLAYDLAKAAILAAPAAAGAVQQQRQGQLKGAQGKRKQQGPGLTR